MYRLLTIAVVAATLASCSRPQQQTDMQTADTSWVAPDKMELYTLTNASGAKATITNFGGKVVSLWVPDKSGKLGDVVLGYDSIEQYPGGNAYFGALIGRCGNRVARGTFTLDGQTYHLAINNGVNSLHGGPGGFHNVLWRGNLHHTDQGDELELTYLSKDGEEGYPGNLLARVTYRLTADNTLAIDYTATTDKPTVVNLSHHSFFNLAGEGNGDILNHQLEIFADYYSPVDTSLIPLGAPASVEGTPFDFRKPYTVGARINNRDEQLKNGRGYDHNYVLSKAADTFGLAARVYEPTSGRVMEVWTDEPGLQFYAGNFLDGKDKGKGGKAYNFRTALCLEAQHYPDSPNHPDYPSVTLRPGETYRQTTHYKFSVKK